MAGADPTLNAGIQRAQRIEVLGSLMLDRDLVLLALASRLAGLDGVFESEVRGNSMMPAIPGGARLRVRLISGQYCDAGDIVFFLSEQGFMVHRIAWPSRRGLASSLTLTYGDNCLVPDVPIRTDQIMGQIIAFRVADGWREAGPPNVRSFAARLIRRMTLTLVVCSLCLNLPAARCMVSFLGQTQRVALSWLRWWRAATHGDG